MKKFRKIAVVLTALLLLSVIPSMAFKPQVDDIYYFDGYDLSSNAVKFESKSEGMKLTFHKIEAIWAMRARYVNPIKLDGEYGFYAKLKDISWTENGSSLVVAFSTYDGGWCDNKTLLFVFVKGDYENNGWNYYLAGVNGNKGNEEVAPNFLEPTQITSDISDELIVTFKKASAAEWALGVNGQTINISNDDVKSRLENVSQSYLVFGAWYSATEMSYTVNELYWDGAFGKAPGATTAPTATPDNTSVPTATPGQTGTPATTPTKAQASPIATGNTTTPKDNTTPWGLIIAIIAVVMVIGGVCCYFFIFKKKRQAKAYHDSKND